jgi:hypothetical protein
MRVLSVASARAPALASVLLLSGWLAACGPDLQPNPDDPSDTEDPGTGPQAPNIRHVDNGDGTVTTTVDASSSDQWIGLDLDHRQQVDGAQDQQWDLAFQRFHIRARGGVSGGGAVEVAMLADVDFAQVRQAPSDGYATDAADGTDDNTEPDTVFESGTAWYSYDPRTHQLSPRSQVYVVRTDEGAYFKVRMLSYYDAAGTPAVLQLQWGGVQAPSPRG